MFINYIDLVCSFVLRINCEMQIGLFNFSSEAEHVLAFFVFLGQIEPQCSHKMCSYKKKELRSSAFTFLNVGPGTPQRNWNNIPHLLRAMPVKVSVNDGKISN